MRNLLILALCIGAVWYGYTRVQARRTPAPVVESVRTTYPSPTPAATPTATPYACDGRIHCSQMTSCAEATFFLKNCPGTKMDGDHDGIPCEQQWCTGR
ncbi:hypothetical protein BH09PSE6_BH09PSE6_11480 [soil metagenome]